MIAFPPLSISRFVKSMFMFETYLGNPIPSSPVVKSTSERLHCRKPACQATREVLMDYDPELTLASECPACFSIEGVRCLVSSHPSDPAQLEGSCVYRCRVQSSRLRLHSISRYLSDLMVTFLAIEYRMHGCKH